MHPAVRTSLIVAMISFVVGVMTMVSAFACAVLGFGGIASLTFEIAKLLGAFTVLAFVVFVFLGFILSKRRRPRTSQHEDETRTFLIWASVGAALAILVAAIMVGRVFDKFGYVDKTVEIQLVAPAK